MCSSDLCSKGTYVRVLGQKIAQHLGSCCTVVSLTRTAASGFELQDAISVEELEKSLTTNISPIITMDDERISIPRLHLRDGFEDKKLKNGACLVIEANRIQSREISRLQRATFLENLLMFDSKAQCFALGYASRVNATQVQVKVKRSLI